MPREITPIMRPATGDSGGLEMQKPLTPEETQELKEEIFRLYRKERYLLLLLSTGFLGLVVSIVVMANLAAAGSLWTIWFFANTVFCAVALAITLSTISDTCDLRNEKLHSLTRHNRPAPPQGSGSFSDKLTAHHIELLEIEQRHAKFGRYGFKINE